jgi:hypothetical protein
VRLAGRKGLDLLVDEREKGFEEVQVLDKKVIGRHEAIEKKVAHAGVSEGIAFTWESVSSAYIKEKGNLPVLSSSLRKQKGRVKTFFATSSICLDLPDPETWTTGMIMKPLPLFMDRVALAALIVLMNNMYTPMAEI